MIFNIGLIVSFNMVILMGIMLMLNIAKFISDNVFDKVMPIITLISFSSLLIGFGSWWLPLMF